jgi:hypothetical protein
VPGDAHPRVLRRDARLRLRPLLDPVELPGFLTFASACFRHQRSHAPGLTRPSVAAVKWRTAVPCRGGTRAAACSGRRLTAPRQSRGPGAAIP